MYCTYIVHIYTHPRCDLRSFHLTPGPYFHRDRSGSHDPSISRVLRFICINLSNLSRKDTLDLIGVFCVENAAVGFSCSPRSRLLARHGRRKAPHGQQQGPSVVGEWRRFLWQIKILFDLFLVLISNTSIFARRKFEY